jgi:hypothetical protein
MPVLPLSDKEQTLYDTSELRQEREKSKMQEEENKTRYQNKEAASNKIHQAERRSKI